MDLKELENWLWDIASILRGPVEAYNYKDYILPLVFLKRISDVYRQLLSRKNHKLKTSHRVALYYPDKPSRLVKVVT